MGPLYGTQDWKTDRDAHGCVVGLKCLEEQIIVVVARQPGVLRREVDAGQKRSVLTFGTQVLRACSLLRGLNSRIALRCALDRIIVLGKRWDGGKRILCGFDVCRIQSCKLGQMLSKNVG